MPVPIIAAALIAGGVITGGSGVVLGGKGAADMKRARDGLKREQSKLEADGLLTDQAVSATNGRLERLGRQQKSALTDVVLRMGEFLRRHHKKVRESERLLVDGIDVAVGTVSSNGSLDPEAVAWIRGLIGSAAAGSGIAAGVTGAVGSVGVASTGAAISGLSGAAADSATLAFLGGGSLASGGGGMILGATALNFVTVGPALLVGGLVTKSQGTKARTQARDHRARVATAMANNELTRTRLAGVDERVAGWRVCWSGLSREPARRSTSWSPSRSFPSSTPRGFNARWASWSPFETSRQLPWSTALAT